MDSPVECNLQVLTSDKEESQNIPMPVQPNIAAIFAMPSTIMSGQETLLAPPIERKFLTYDGTHLGEFEFVSVVSWCHPCTKVTSGMKSVALFAIINLPGMIEPQHVILKRNSVGHTDQLVIDELKSVFGLHKMGTHAIRLRGVPRRYNNSCPWIVDGPNGEIINVFIHPQWSEYLVFRATITRDKVTDRVTFVPLPTLEKTQWIPTSGSEIREGHRRFYYEIQKILVYRDLMRIGNTNLSDILVKSIGKQIVPLSIDEMVIKGPTDTHRKLTQELEKFFFPKTTSKTQIIIKMLGLTKENYREQVEFIRNSMTKIISRVDQEKLWLVDDVVNQIVDRCTIYYGLIEDL